MDRRLSKWAQRAPASVVGTLLCVLVGGCVDSHYCSREVRASRLASYQRWRAARIQGSAAVPSVKGRLTLQDAIKVALLYNKALQSVLHDKEVARGRLIASYAEALPSLTAVGNYTRLDRLGGFNVGGQAITVGELDNYSVDLQVRQPIFRSGAIPAALRAAQIFSHLTDATVRNQVQATIFAVARNYYDALLAKRLYEVNRDAVLSAEAHLKDVQNKLKNGVASRFDVLRAQVDVSNFRAEMIQQQNRLHLAKTQLLKAMGVSQQAEVTLADELSYEPVRPILEEAVRIAHLNRPDLYAAELGVRLQKEAVRIAKSRYGPRVDALFTQGWSRPDPHTSTDDWGRRWTAGVQVEIPIFDGLRREGQLIQEKATLQKREAELSDAEERALLEIQQALVSLRDAEELVESQRMNLERAKEGLRLAQVGYREGVNTEVEVVDARAALTRARGLYYQAIHSHTVARLALQRAMGILGPRAGDRAVPTESPVRPAHIEEFSSASRSVTPPATQPAPLSARNDAQPTPDREGVTNR